MAETYSVSGIREVPTYKLEQGETWFHFLHGNVPGHQIDYIVRPEVPQAGLTPQHFSHLSRLVKYIEPRRGSAYAFAIANLSRDDTQYEPGHGGIALIFGLRIKGARDHDGRQDPPFCHAAAAVDRQLDGDTLYRTALEFYHKLLPDGDSQAEGSGWYHTYVQHAQNANVLDTILKSYLADFKVLPILGPSGLSHRWTVEGSTLPRRVVITYPDETAFDTLAHCMARIANVLVESDIKWTALSNGRESDVVGGLTVRFVPECEATDEAADVIAMQLDQVPEDAAEIAQKLFHAREARRTNRREMRLHRRQAEAEAAAPMNAAPNVEKAPAPVEVVLGQTAELRKKQRKRQFTTLIGFGVLIVAFGTIAAVWVGSTPTPVELGAPVMTNAAPMVTNAAPMVTNAAPEMTNTPAVPTVSATPSAMVQDKPPVVNTDSTKPGKVGGRSKPAPPKPDRGTKVFGGSLE